MKQTVRVLGIDPGTLKLGYAVIECQPGKLGPGAMRYLECGVIKAPKIREIGPRLHAIAQELDTVIAEFTPKTCAIEKAFHGTNARSALTLGQARGALMLLAHQRGMDTFEYAPAHIKRVVAGHGAADKTQIAERVRMLFGLRRAPAADAADALAIACCHALAR
ncbi:MAG TPA: crossover junction endodeoxyribonuclease RuvC [Nannocystaceae bacterium]|nr:crossover junction endodeoxyribonuclease RuvC [Nannocystaceae bacterium]